MISQICTSLFREKKKTLTLFLFSIFSIFFPTFSYAQQPLDWWEKHSPEINEMTQDKNCEGIFNFLWPEAKNGNLQARMGLAVLILPYMHGDLMTMPGYKDDIVTRIRHATILSVHSLGAIPEDKAMKNDVTSLWENYLYDPRLLGDKNFRTCLETNRSQKCAEIAVKEKMIPSFEVYAKEIDNLIAQGGKPQCDFYADHKVKDSSLDTKAEK